MNAKFVVVALSLLFARECSAGFAKNASWKQYEAYTKEGENCYLNEGSKRYCPMDGSCHTSCSPCGERHTYDNKNHVCVEPSERACNEFEKFFCPSNKQCSTELDDPKIACNNCPGFEFEHEKTHFGDMENYYPLYHGTCAKATPALCKEQKGSWFYCPYTEDCLSKGGDTYHEMNAENGWSRVYYNTLCYTHCRYHRTMDYTNNRCIAPSRFTCPEDNERVFCPTDYTCKPKGNCSTCPGGRTFADPVNHICIKPSGETCSKISTLSDSSTGGAWSSTEEDGLTRATAAKSCSEILATQTVPKSGVYWLKQHFAEYPIDQEYQFYCDMESNGGGWTLLGTRSKTTRPMISNDYLRDLYGRNFTDPNAIADNLYNGSWAALGFNTVWMEFGNDYGRHVYYTNIETDEQRNNVYQNMISSRKEQSPVNLENKCRYFDRHYRGAPIDRNPDEVNINKLRDQALQHIGSTFQIKGKEDKGCGQLTDGSMWGLVGNPPSMTTYCWWAHGSHTGSGNCFNGAGHTARIWVRNENIILYPKLEYSTTGYALKAEYSYCPAANSCVKRTAVPAYECLRCKGTAQSIRGETMPVFDKESNTCVACHDQGGMEYCPIDGLCKPAGDCSGCGDYTTVDKVHHQCIFPSGETCYKARLNYCPLTGECVRNCKRCNGTLATLYSRGIQIPDCDKTPPYTCKDDHPNPTVSVSKHFLPMVYSSLNTRSHTCQSCHDNGNGEFCPADGRCKPRGDCSSCKGYSGLDETHHTCITPSQDSCSKDGGKFYCPSDQSCKPNLDCSTCPGRPRVDENNYLCAACENGMAYCPSEHSCKGDASCELCDGLPIHDGGVCKACAVDNEKMLCPADNSCKTDCASECTGFTSVNADNSTCAQAREAAKCVILDNCGRRPSRVSCDSSLFDESYVEGNGRRLVGPALYEYEDNLGACESDVTIGISTRAPPADSAAVATPPPAYARAYPKGTELELPNGCTNSTCELIAHVKDNEHPYWSAHYGTFTWGDKVQERDYMVSINRWPEKISDMSESVSTFFDLNTPFTTPTSCAEAGGEGLKTILLGGTTKTVYCDNSRDGGGWMLLVADNGKNDPWDLPDNPTNEAAGRLRLPDTVSITAARVIATGSVINGASKTVNLRTDNSHFVENLATAMTSASTDQYTIRTDPQVAWTVGDGNQCLLAPRPVGHFYKKKHAHTWIFGHNSGYANGWIQVGSSYNIICDQTFGVSDYSDFKLQLWVKATAGAGMQTVKVPPHLMVTVRMDPPSESYTIQYNHFEVEDSTKHYRHRGGVCFNGSAVTASKCTTDYKPQFQNLDPVDGAYRGTWYNGNCHSTNSKNNAFGWFHAGDCGTSGFGPQDFSNSKLIHNIDRSGMYRDPPIGRDGPSVVSKEYWLARSSWSFYVYFGRDSATSLNFLSGMQYNFLEDAIEFKGVAEATVDFGIRFEWRDKVSLEYYFKVASIDSSDMVPLVFDGVPSAGAVYLYVKHNFKITLSLNNGVDTRTSTAAYPELASSYSHLVLAKDGETFNVYFNGDLVADLSGAFSGTTFSNTMVDNKAKMGQGGGNGHFYLRYLKHYGHTLDVAAVTELYDAATKRHYNDRTWDPSVFGELSKAQTLEKEGWTKCLTAAKGTFGYSTWRMTGSTCFGEVRSQFMVRGSEDDDKRIIVEATDFSTYETFCKSITSVDGGDMKPEGGEVTTAAFWGSSMCYIGGNNNVGGDKFYGWNHNCGADYTIAIGVTKGTGCDGTMYELGDLEVWVK